MEGCRRPIRARREPGEPSHHPDLRLLRDEEGRTVGIYARSRWLGGPVGQEVFGCNHSLLNASRRSRTVAADAQDAFAPVGILDSQDRVAVSAPGADQIIQYGKLEIC